MKRFATCFMLTLVAVLLLGTTASAQTTYTSTASGPWSTMVWAPAGVPGALDNVIIADGNTVTIDQAVAITNLTVGQGVSGRLTFDGVAVRAVVVTGNIIIATGGIFNTPPIFTPTGDITTGSAIVANVSSTVGVVVGMSISGTGIPALTTVTAFDATSITMSANATATTVGLSLTVGWATVNTLALTGNLTNNGTLDLSQLVGFAAISVCNVTFNNTTGDQTITGTTPVMTRLRGVTLAKGAVGNRVVCNIDVSKSGGTQWAFTAGTWEQTAGTLTFSNGNEQTFLGSANAALVISGTANFSDPGASLTTTGGTLTCNTSGTFSMGNGSNSMVNTTGSINFFSGTVYIGGRLTMTGGTTTISGANITIDPQAASNLGATSNTFEYGPTSIFNFTSGSVTIVDPNAGADSRTGKDLKFPVITTGSINWTGGILYLGDGVSTTPAAGTGFIIQGGTPLGNVVFQGGNIVGRNAILTANVVVNGSLSMRSGTIDITTNSKTLTYGASGTLKYDGATAITSTDAEFPAVSGPANLTMNNAAGLNLHASRTLGGALTLTSGNITTGANTLTLGSAATITGGSSTSYVDGKLARTYAAPASLAFPIGKGGNYRPLSLNYTALDLASTVTAEQFESGWAGTPPAGIIQVGTRYWNVTQIGATTYTYDITLNPTGLSFIGSPRILKYDSPNTLALTTTTPNYTATGLNTLSDFAFGAVDPTVSVFPYAEGFESTTFPPTNWTSAILSGTYNWDRVTSGTNPTQTPYSGVGEARFQSYNAAAPANARLMTPPLAVPPLGLQVIFQMYHDNGYSSNADSITVDVTTNGGTTWTGVAKFLRYNATNAWQSHLVSLSGYTGTINVGFHAWSRYGNNMFIDSVLIRETPLIPPDPAGLVSPANAGTNVLPTATLNWSVPGGGGGVTGYKLYFGTDGGGVTPPTNIVNGTNLGIVLTYDPTPDMAFSTTYYWQVVPTGPGGDAIGCPIWSFATGADPTIAAFPYAEGFESLTFPPYGWTNTGTTLWTRSTGNAYAGAADAHIIYGHTGNSILTSPPINLPAAYRISWWWKDADASLAKPVKQAKDGGKSNPLIAAHDTTFFEISTNGGSTWSTLDFLSAPAPQTTWSHVVRDLSAYAGSNFYFRFRDWCDGTFSSYGSGVDSIRLEALPVGPPDPAGIVSPVNAAANVAITATLNWSAPTTGGPLTGYKLYYGTDNPPTNIVNGTNLGNVLTYDPTPDMAYSTTYYWQVVPTGGGGDAVGCPIWSFATGGNPLITVFPYGEGFEDVAFPPYAWTSTILSGTYNWTRVTAGTSPTQLPYSGVGEAKFESFNAVAGSHARLATRPLQVPTGGLQVLFYMYQDPGYLGTHDSVTVEVSTDAGANWTGLATFYRDNAVASWQSHLVPLTGYTGTIQVGFNAGSAYGDNMYIDSVLIRQTPVGAPDPAGIVSPLNAATGVPITATLHWSAPTTGGALTGYKLYFGTDNPPTNIVNGTNLGNVLTYDPTPDMLYSTPYYWQIVPTGPGGDATGCPVWSFTTGVNPAITTFPYTQNFDAVTFPPYGWTKSQIGATAGWGRQTGKFHSSPACAGVIYTPAGTSYLVTPPIVLPAGHRIKFWWNDYDVDYSPLVTGTDSTWFEISTDAGATWTILADLTRPTAVNLWEEANINLSAYAGTVLLRWRDWTDGTASAWGSGIDDIVIEAIPLDVPPTISYGILPSTNSTGARVLTATIKDNVAVDSSALGGPRLWYRSATTLPLAGAYTPVVGARVAPGDTNWTFAFPAFVSGTFVDYYVAAQDYGAPINVATVPAGTAYTNTPPNGTVAAPNYFAVKSPLTFTVGASGADFTSITDVMTWLYPGIDGPVQILLNTDYSSAGEIAPIYIGGIVGLGLRPTVGPAISVEDPSLVLSSIHSRPGGARGIPGLGAKTSSDAMLITNTLTIKPNTGATPGPISGVESVNGGMIYMEAVSGVTIEGLTVENTGTYAAIFLGWGVSENRIVNCTLKSSCSAGNAVGTIWLYNAFPGGGNVFDNCDISAVGGFNGIAVRNAGISVNDTVRNCHIHDFGFNSATSQLGYGMRLLNGTTNMVIENNVIYDVVPYVGATTFAKAGISIGSTLLEPMVGTIVRNNIIRDLNAVTANSVFGVTVGGFNVNGLLVEGNTIRDLGATTVMGGAGPVIRGVTTAAGTNIIWSRNTIKDLHTATVGALVMGARVSANVGVQKNTFENNMIVLGNAGSNADISYQGISDAGSTDDTTVVAYNSVYIGGLASTGTTDGYIRSGTGTSTLRNNILHNQRSGGVANYAIRSTPVSGGVFNSNYNDVYADGGGGVLGAFAGVDQVTLAAWQTASGGDANSANADPLYVDPLLTANLHITSSSSPASNTGTPVAGITVDFDGDLRNATTPDMGADEFASSMTVGVPVALSWNIVSLPVAAPVPDDSVQHIFTNSVNKYGFAFVGGYVQQYVMTNGPALWIKSSAGYTQNITGSRRDTLTIPVVAAWNMIGSISTSIDTSAARVTPSVPGLRGSNFFKYLGGYVIATTIEPGLGYWVRANSAGSFFMHATGPAMKATEPMVGEGIGNLNSITIRDANGGSQTLYFGADAGGEIPVAMYAMPPAPPVGAFDARFSAADGGSMVQTHAVKVSDALEFPVTVQSVAYPLTVTWNVNKGTASYELADGMGGQVFRAKEMRGEGSIKITNSGVSKFSIKLVGDGQLPKEFALSQNYPNPFNPTTSIKYALPVDSKLTMEIYNVLGQRVRTLVSDNVVAGYHVAEWNGMGSEGQQVGSGTYFLKLSAAGVNGARYSEVRKLLLLK